MGARVSAASRADSDKLEETSSVPRAEMVTNGLGSSSDDAADTQQLRWSGMQLSDATSNVGRPMVTNHSVV
eukprot:3247059-Prymnesium_polylepis.3